MKSGILSHFRSKGLNIYNTKYFKITSPKYVSLNSGFCSVYGTRWRDGRAVFDGDLNTAFASEDLSSPENKNVSIEFLKRPIFINGYTIKTLCSPPKEIIVKGSNDGIHWSQIDHMKTALEEHKISSFVCDHPGSYRIIRFTQIGKCTDDIHYRMHINEIEIHGYVIKNFTRHLKKRRLDLRNLLFIISLSLQK